MKESEVHQERERERDWSYHMWAYLSSIQHDIIKKLNYLTFVDGPSQRAWTARIRVLKANYGFTCHKVVTSGMLSHSMAFMLDEWEIQLYAIIPSLQERATAKTSSCGRNLLQLKFVAYKTYFYNEIFWSIEITTLEFSDLSCWVPYWILILFIGNIPTFILSHKDIAKQTETTQQQQQGIRSWQK